MDAAGVMTDNKNLVLKNRIGEIKRLFKAFESFCRKKCPDAHFKYVMQLSLEEIFTNIVKYGYDDSREHEIAVRFEWLAQRLRVSFEDDGVPFNPLTAAEPDVSAALKERRIGGLGIHMVRTLMDRVSYERVKNKNILTFEKQIAVEDGP